MTFSGSTFEPKLDEARLTRQLDRVRGYMLNRGQCGYWRTLEEIEEQLGYPQASISARLRDLRKEGLTVERRRRADGKRGLFEYRVSKPVREAEQLVLGCAQ